MGGQGEKGQGVGTMGPIDGEHGGDHETGLGGEEEGPAEEEEG